MNTAAAVASHLNILESTIAVVEEWAHVLFVRFVSGRPRFVSKKVQEVDAMFNGNIEYVQGQESHTSYWGKFYVKGLEDFVCKEDDDRNRRDNHHSFQCYVGNDIPEGTMFSVFVQDGNKRGTDLFEFYICKVSEQVSQIKHHYTGCDIQGNFEVVAQGLTKTKGPRLMDWWNSHEQTLEVAERCATYINKRGQKNLPAE